jgi:hypothetical protein
MGLQLRTKRQADEIAPSPRGCRILALFARACPELVEGVGGDAAGATFVRSTLPVVDAVVVSTPFDFALSKIPTSRAKSAREMGHPEFQLRWAESLCALRAGSSQSTRRTGHLVSLSFTSWAATPAAHGLRGGSTQRAGRSVPRYVR